MNKSQPKPSKPHCFMGEVGFCHIKTMEPPPGPTTPQTVAPLSPTSASAWWDSASRRRPELGRLSHVDVFGVRRSSGVRGSFRSSPARTCGFQEASPTRALSQSIARSHDGNMMEHVYSFAASHCTMMKYLNWVGVPRLDVA